MSDIYAALASAIYLAKRGLSEVTGDDERYLCGRIWPPKGGKNMRFLTKYLWNIFALAQEENRDRDTFAAGLEERV